MALMRSYKKLKSYEKVKIYLDGTCEVCFSLTYNYIHRKIDFVNKMFLNFPNKF